MRKEPNLFKVCILSLVFAFIVGLVGIETAWATDTSLKIGLATNQRTGYVFSKSMLYFKDASGKTFKASGKVLLKTNSPKKIYVNGKSATLPLAITSKTPIYWGNRPYRGWLQIYPSSQGFNVINVISVEQYLRGVLKMEVNPAWQMEALKAQAVVARTYALRNKGKHSSQGFDLCALPHCQVYRGINAEDPKLDRAITSTKGLVLYYGSKLAVTPYHSDSGGYTANVWDVWSGNIPYLKAQKEPFSYVSPYSNWRAVIPLGELESKLRKNGINLGKIQRITIAKRDEGGRAVSILIEGTGGRKTIKASKFRMIAGSDKIRSTNFEIKGVGKNRSTPTGRLSNQLSEEAVLNDHDGKLLSSLVKEGVFSTEELMDMLVHPERKPHYLRVALQRQSGTKSKTSYYFASSNGNALVLEGRGWGHGVGMSQWGAKSMAEHGWDFKKILMYYYPGTKLKKIY
ncbi:SpoIID/LytB domain-containing protein [Thermovirga lienii]|uniref:SpoIID/LytB domain-containing protein n=1 Tax=Thermovirga lienii TaxID=336261 RepID=UPI002FE3AFD6